MSRFDFRVLLLRQHGLDVARQKLVLALRPFDCLVPMGMFHDVDNPHRTKLVQGLDLLRQ